MNRRPALIGLTALVLCAGAHAFQLSPFGTKAERRQANRSEFGIRAEMVFAEAGLHIFSEPVHETLTQLIFDCGTDWNDCSDPDLEHAGAYVIAGVRWNDDPVFLLSAGEAAGLRCRISDTVSFITQTTCWLGLFKDAQKKAIKDPTHFLKPGVGNYMSRSHLGDLQFLHAMAGVDGESPVTTKNKVMMWAEFTWKVAIGHYRLGTELKSIDIPGWTDHFLNGQNVQDLFTLGRPWLRPHVREVAFGSLLHVIQDSFAEGHVSRREPVSGASCDGGRHRQHGHIAQFHSYARQDHQKHKDADSPQRARRHLALHIPDVVDAGRVLRDYFERAAPWAEVQPYLSECVLPLRDDAAGASAGDGFR